MAVHSFTPFRKNGYTPLSTVPPSFGANIVRKVIVVIVAVIGLSFLAYPLYSHPNLTSSLSFHNTSPIPNIVHYIYLRKDEAATISFNFAYFLSLYATVMHIAPKRILIHTDFTSAEITHAATHGDPWTRKTLQTFKHIVHFNPVAVPQYSGPNNTIKIKYIQHKSDFVRWVEVEKTGGIYIDSDVYALRPLTPLLNSGFSFIAGRQKGEGIENGAVINKVNNGVFMSKPHSAVTRLMVRDQAMAFATGPYEANLMLLTRVMNALVKVPNEVLICDRHAFSPTSWADTSTRSLYSHNKNPSPVPIETDSLDPVVVFDAVSANKERKMDWEMDLSATYLLHAFKINSYEKEITPKKILKRTSNFGVAMWPVVRRMVEEGLISGNEDE